MDDGSQKLLDVIDDPSALESFLGLSGEGSDRVTLESIVDTLQQGLLEVGGSRHGGTGPSAGSLVLTQQQLQQLQFQAHHLQQSASAGGGRQFVLPTHTISSTSGSTIPSSASHVVLAPFSHHGSPNSTMSHTIVTQHAQQRSFMSASGMPGSSANVAFSSSRILGSIGSSTGSGVQIGSSNISSSIGVGNPNSVIGSAGISIGTSGSNLGASGMPGMPANSTTIFGTSGIPLGHSGVLVGPSGTVFQTSVSMPTGAVASPGSPFSIPTRSPASHAPPTPSPSPLPLRSPAHPPSPAQSPYQSPQNSHSSSSTSFIAASPATVLKDNFSNLSLVQQSGLISCTQANSFKESFGQSSMVLAPQPRSSQTSNNAARNSPSPYSNMSTVGNRTSPSSHGIHNCPSNSQVLLPQQQSRGCTTRSPAPVPCGTLTPAPSPSPQQRTVPSPVIGSTPQQRAAASPVIGAAPTQSAQTNVIQQTLTTGLTLSSGQQFPVVQSGGATMLPAGNHQLVQIIHHPQASASLQTHTPLITTTVSGPAVHLQPSSTTPTKPKQPPQILPKPPGSSTIVAQGTAHSKITSGSRGNITNTSQHQGLHPQHASAGTQVVIGGTNPTAVIPTAQGGALLLNQVIPGLAHGAPVLVQQNTAGGVQFILRPPTPGTAVQTTKTTGAQGATPMLISGTQLVSSAARPQTVQPQQVLRLITAQGATMQLQQIQTPSGPTFIAVPSGQTLSFQQMPQLSTAAAQPAPSQPMPQPQSAAPAPPISTHQQPQPNTFHISQNANMLPTVLNSIPHSISQHNNLTTNSSIDGSSLHCNVSLNSAPAICSHAGMRDTRGFSSAESDIDESCSGRTGDVTLRGDRMLVVPPPLPPPKKKPKKKKKKKKDEEPKLDLANLMKLSGIDDEDGMTIYESEEQGVPLTNHQEEDVSSSSDRFSSSSTRQPSNLMSHLQNGAQASVRLLLEDGKVVLQHVPDAQQDPSSNVGDVLHNLVSSEGGHSNSGGLQHNLTAAQQLSALLAAHGNQSGVVFSQLLQQQQSQQQQTQQQIQHPQQSQQQSQQHQPHQQHQLQQHQPQSQQHQQASQQLQPHHQQPQQLHQHHHFQQINHVGTSTPQLISTGTNTSQNSPQDTSQPTGELNPKPFGRDGSLEVRHNDVSQTYGIKGPSPTARNFSNVGTGHTSVIINRDSSDIPPTSSISVTNRPQCPNSPNIVCIGNLPKTARCSGPSVNCNSSSMQHHIGSDVLPNSVLSRNTSDSVPHVLPNSASLVDGRNTTVVSPRGCLNQLDISNNSCSDETSANRSHGNLSVRPSTGNSTTQTDSVIELPTSHSSIGIPLNSSINSTTLPQPLQHGNIIPKMPDGFTPAHLNKPNITNPENSPAILGLHAFPNLQSLVSSGGAVPIVAVPPISSGANSNLGTALTYTGTEQLVIAHPGGLSSVLATPQLLHCIQQAHAQQSGLVSMPSIQITPNIINKALGNTGIALNTGTGTILIGSAPTEAFTATPSAKAAPTVVAANPKVIPQQPVIVQQLNPNIRRSSSDSNSSLSLGSPPPMISIVSQNSAAGPHHVTSTVRKVQQSHQSIETQTVSIGTPCSSSSSVITGLPNAFLETLAQTHPNILVKNFGKPGLTAVQTNTTSPSRKSKKKRNERPAPIKITPSNTAINVSSVGQPDFSNIASNTTCIHQRSNTIQTTEEMKTAAHDRLFKNIVANNQNVAVPCIDSSTEHHIPGPTFQMTTTAATRVINRNILPTSNLSPVNPCTIVPRNTHNVPCHVTTATTTTVTSATPVPVNVTVQQNQSNKPLQIGKSVGTQIHSLSPGESPNRIVGITTAVRRPQPGPLVTTVANASNKICSTTTVHSNVCGTIQNVVAGQHNHQPVYTNSSSGVPHLLPFSQTSGSVGSSQTSGSSLLPSASIIQKVQTIQLTQVNQKHLKQVQLQIESFAAKKNLTGADQIALQKLYEEQKRILATGKVVPTVPGQHAQGLQFNMSLSSESTEEDCKPSERQTSSSNTYLASLLRQPVSNQNSQISNPVRYHHQVGNHVIAYTPTQQKVTAPGAVAPIHRPVTITPPVSRSPNLEGNPHAPSSEPSISVAPRLSVPCATADVHQTNIQMCVSASVIRPTIPPPVSKERPSSDIITCEKSTSPIQVQVGTQTLPCGEPSPCLSAPSSLSPKSPVRPPLPQVFSSSPNSKPQLQTFNKILPVTTATQSSSSLNISTTSTYTPVSVNNIRTATAPVSPSVPGPSVTQKPPPISPLRPTISRTELIEHQLNTDRKEACGPDVHTPFMSKGDACKRLVRYHVFNEQVLSEQDLEKADEIFEATAKHLLDKFRQMTNKYRYLLLMESMREVNTSELIMIDRMFVAEEHNILEKLQQDEHKVKEESKDEVPEIKQEPCSGDLREVRVMVQDVMKNVSIKRELEEERKVTVVKREHLDKTNYDEWVEIQKELGVVYSNTRQAEVKIEPEESSSVCDPSESESKTPLVDRLDTDDESSLIEDIGRDPSSDDSIPRTSFNCSSDREFTWERTTPRDENIILREGGIENHCDSDSLKRKESFDSVTYSHRKKRHKQESVEEDCIDDDINAQVQSAIDSILNLQRSEDGIEESQQYVNKKSVDKVSSLLEVHCNRLQQCDDSPELVVGLCDEDNGTGEGSGSTEGDPALDEAVRSILTS